MKTGAVSGKRGLAHIRGRGAKHYVFERDGS